MAAGTSHRGSQRNNYLLSYYKEVENETLSPDQENVELSGLAMKQSESTTSLKVLLASIKEERHRDEPNLRLISSDDNGFVMVSRSTFWVNLFQLNFLDGPDDNKDDLVFYIRKNSTKSKHNIPRTEVEVYRKISKNQPTLIDPQIEWEETVYLNLIMQHFEYYVTCAVCVRTGDRDLQILKKYSQRVYASPSRRRMESKGTKEEITYPNIFFTVDNFEEAFSDIIVRDPEMVCVELVAKDRQGQQQGVIFLGSIKYESLKKVYDSRASLSHRMAQKMSLGWYNGQKRVEFVRMRGPQGKGHAEMAVSRMKGSGPDTPEQTPSTENFPLDDFEQDFDQDGGPRQRRMSDPNQAAWNSWMRGSLRASAGGASGAIRKSRSEAERVDNTVASDGSSEVQASNIRDEFDGDAEHYHGFFGQSFGQAWHWFKERKRANCVALHAHLTYVTLPWHRIIADITEEDGVLQPPVFLCSYAGACVRTSVAIT